mgnify:CR=1 FL=1
MSEEMIILSFGDRLKEARLKRNLTQKQLADMLGVKNTTIANYETEVSSPKEEILLKIFDVLHVSPNYLFQDSFDEEIIKEKEIKKIVNFSDREIKLIENYRLLNENGKRKIDEYMIDLINSSNYANTEDEFSAEIS